MEHALGHCVGKSTSNWQQRALREDPLDAIRGILLGTLVSVLGFWLPLALALVK